MTAGIRTAESFRSRLQLSLLNSPELLEICDPKNNYFQDDTQFFVIADTEIQNHGYPETLRGASEWATNHFPSQIPRIPGGTLHTER